MTTSAIQTTDNAALLSEFSGGASSDVAMMIGVGLVKDTEAVFFQYLGEEQQPSALMLPSGKPLTRLANVTLSGIDIAEEVGEFKSTKLNLFLQSSARPCSNAHLRSDDYLVTVSADLPDGYVSQL